MEQKEARIAGLPTVWAWIPLGNRCPFSFFSRSTRRRPSLL